MTRDWEAHYRGAAEDEPQPAQVLAWNAHLLPAAGRSLDLACGRGGNALLLARHGLETLAWDSAAAAIDALRALAAAEGLAIQAEVRDVVRHPPAPDGFDVIVVSRFLERELAPALIAALRPGGLLFYQTFTRQRVSDRGPRTEGFRLDDNELLTLFSPLRVRYYREEGGLGNTRQGFRDEALLVAERPSPA
ncbi:methyltransferase domain-containing protein [Ectothiorhodospiraceae bacterium WFHF3C12]|nr:methyltransferase domain-containing protein [Ectothiorhodospiraceae bacterium WFHF3C12]